MLEESFILAATRKRTSHSTSVSWRAISSSSMSSKVKLGEKTDMFLGTYKRLS